MVKKIPGKYKPVVYTTRSDVRISLLYLEVVSRFLNLLRNQWYGNGPGPTTLKDELQ